MRYNTFDTPEPLFPWQQDQEYILTRIQHRGLGILKQLDASMTADKKFMSQAVICNGLALQYASEELRGDIDVVQLAVNENGEALQYASLDLKENPIIVRHATDQTMAALAYASPKLQSDRNFILERINQDGQALYYADKRLRSDGELIVKSIRNDKNKPNKGRSFYYSTPDMKADYNLVHDLLRYSGLILKYVNIKLRQDRNIVLVAVRQNGLALEYADCELRRDFDLVLVAVTQNGMALRYAANDLKSNTRIVRRAVKQNGIALSLADDACKANKNIVLLALKSEYRAVKYVDTSLLSDPDIILTMMKPRLCAYLTTSSQKKTIKQNLIKWGYTNADAVAKRSFYFSYVKPHGRLLQQVCSDIRANKDIMLKVVAQNAFSFRYIAPILQSDKDVVLTAVSNASCLHYADEIFRTDKDIAYQVVKHLDIGMSFLHHDLLKDRDLMTAAMRYDDKGRCAPLWCARRQLKSDNDFVMKYIQHNITKRNYVMPIRL